MERFSIINTIDFGADGKFGPGRERALAKYLSEQKQGKKLFKRLVERGAVEVETESQPVTEDEVTSKKSGGENDIGDGDGDNTKDGENGGDGGPEIDGPDYPPTGKYEAKHYGGGNFEIIDPDGHVIDTVKGNEPAQAKVDELNAEI